MASASAISVGPRPFRVREGLGPRLIKRNHHRLHKFPGFRNVLLSHFLDLASAVCDRDILPERRNI